MDPVAGAELGEQAGDVGLGVPQSFATLAAWAAAAAVLSLLTIRRRDV